MLPTDFSAISFPILPVPRKRGPVVLVVEAHPAQKKYVNQRGTVYVLIMQQGLSFKKSVTLRNNEHVPDVLHTQCVKTG